MYRHAVTNGKVSLSVVKYSCMPLLVLAILCKYNSPLPTVVGVMFLKITTIGKTKALWVIGIPLQAHPWKPPIFYCMYTE
jgi:hypothetical protein